MAYHTPINHKKIFELVTDLYIILSTDLIILDVNRALEKASMKTKEELIGHYLFEVFPDNPNDKTANGVSNLSKSLQSVLTQKKSHTMAVQKYDIQRPDGIFEVRYWSPVNTPVLNSENEIEYIIHRVQDVTEYMLLKKENDTRDLLTEGLQKKVDEMEVEIIQRSTEIQKLNFELEKKVKERTETLLKREITLAEQNQKLQNQNKELEQFTYITSHDLQEPLRSLISFSELLEKEFSDKLDGNGAIYIDFITKSSKRMRALVKGLLDYSRIGNNKELVETDCNQIINDVQDDMTSIIQESEAKITIDTLPVLKCYPTEMRQLFQNLISNAIKFRKKDSIPEIKISVTENQNNWIFSVQDNGIGIDQKDIHKLFIIFKRLNNRDEYEGTGIGLAHCKKIVELHGGTIWANAELNKQSTFTFIIPKL
nr:ATP-binding protein [uncultured Flavobacterium sp.]